MYDALLLYLLSVPVKVDVNAAGNEALRRTGSVWSVVRSTRIAQRGVSERLASACLCLKSNYVGRVTSLPSDGD